MKFVTTRFLLLISFLAAYSLNAQTIVWTGSAGDSAFFNEANWKNTTTNVAPPAGTIDPGVAVNATLLIENASAVIGGNSGISSDILMGTGNLTIRKSTLKMADGKGIDMGVSTNMLTVDSAVVTTEFLKNTTTTISGDSKLYLSSANPFDTNSNLNITSTDAWIFAKNLNANTAITSHIPRVKINGTTLSDMNNGRVSQYYSGCAIAAYNSAIAPLRVFDATGLNGNYADIPVQTIYSGTNIPSNMNDNIASFKLKKGYMVTLSVDNDGTGISKVYIASESDLIVNSLPSALSGKISFIRVLPWIWVNKKGTGGNISNPKGSWFYDWGLSASSSFDREYAPMCWGKTGLDTQTKRNTVINKKKITHIMSFNEADDCNGQSGQYGLLCVFDTAALWHRNAMKTGLRIVSPSGREGTETSWLKSVNTIMVPAGTRMDVIGMHWYDWGGYSSGAASDANSIFTRFKNKVIACYNYYKMPIWITEFNANKNRPREIQDAFLQLALPWLESTPYVERYAYFQPNGGNGSFLDANGNLTTTGTIYLNQASTPSVPENYVNFYNNNLQSRMNEITTVEEIVASREQVQYQYNRTSKLLHIKSQAVDSVNLYNLQGICLKQLKPNTNIVLNNLPSGIYILTSVGCQACKIIVD